MPPSLALSTATTHNTCKSHPKPHPIRNVDGHFLSCARKQATRTGLFVPGCISSWLGLQAILRRLEPSFSLMETTKEERGREQHGRRHDKFRCGRRRRPWTVCKLCTVQLCNEHWYTNIGRGPGIELARCNARKGRHQPLGGTQNLKKVLVTRALRPSRDCLSQVMAIPCSIAPGPDPTLAPCWAVHSTSVSLATLICRVLLFGGRGPWPHVGRTGRAHAGNFSEHHTIGNPRPPTPSATLQDPASCQG